jgi:hypothetical protein
LEEFSRHREHYAKKVTPCTKMQVSRLIGSTRIVKSTCPHFSDIPLSVWDQAARFLDQKGSLATQVCVLKEAAKQIREEYLDGS